MNPARIGDTVHYTQLTDEGFACYAALVCDVLNGGDSLNLRVYEPNACDSFGLHRITYDADAIQHDGYADRSWFDDDLVTPGTWHHIH